MQINGVTIKTPMDLTVGVFRIASEAERTASGLMVLDVIAIKRRLDLTYTIISDAELKAILDILEGGVFHSVTYPDPQGGEAKTITAYVGDINQGAFFRRNGVRYWKDVRLALIEQ